MHDSHIQEVLSCCNMRAFDPVPEEDVAHDQEVDVATMRWNYYQRALVCLVMALQTCNGSFVDHNSFVDRPEDLVKEPGKGSDGTH